jgi:hypothetical protein
MTYLIGVLVIVCAFLFTAALAGVAFAVARITHRLWLGLAVLLAEMVFIIPLAAIQLGRWSPDD